jgi:hypothetical protein
MGNVAAPQILYVKFFEEPPFQALKGTKVTMFGIAKGVKEAEYKWRTQTPRKNYRWVEILLTPAVPGENAFISRIRPPAPFRPV